MRLVTFLICGWWATDVVFLNLFNHFEKKSLSESWLKRRAGTFVPFIWLCYDCKLKQITDFFQVQRFVHNCSCFGWFVESGERGNVWPNICQVLGWLRQLIYYIVGFLPLGNTFSLHFLRAQLGRHLSVYSNIGSDCKSVIFFWFFKYLGSKKRYLRWPLLTHFHTF